MHKPIRILHVITKLTFGGVQSNLMNYYRHIDRSKVQFDFVVQSPEIEYFEPEVESLGGIIYRVPPLHIDKKSFEREFKKVLSNDVNYKIVHVHQNFLNIIPLKIAKKAGIPVRVSHSHSHYPANNFITIAKRIAFKKLLPLYATDFYACSIEAGKWLYGKKIIEKPNFKVIVNGIETEKFAFKQKVREEYRKKLMIENATVYVHSGMFTDAKNHAFLLEIFKEIQNLNSNTKLLLIGDGSKKEELNLLSKRLEIEKDVIFLGKKENVQDFLFAADFFIFPSKFEGLGMSVIEAQMTGLSCFVSNRVPKEVNLFNKTCFLDIQDTPQKWAEEICDNNFSNKQRLNTDLNNSLFNIKNQAPKLLQYYLKSIQSAQG
ncbi:glycosyltransferase family 1 protein [Planococcus sp. 11815]|uniref:glycosyltransferase family 1 protein n=1 Tax=Planococcus sp. 11815 TaxID=2939413 RepID=UPI003DA53D71